MTLKAKKPKKVGFWDVVKLSFNELDLAANIEKAIPNRFYFIILYIIDPDILIYYICKELRENGLVYPGMPDDNDMLEDVIGPIVHKIFSQSYIQKREMSTGISSLKNLILARLSENENQHIMDGILKQRW